VTAAHTERETALRIARSRSAAGAVAWSLASTQILFWSFAAGSYAGPGPLTLRELVPGAMSALLLGMVVASIMVRRRLESPALVVLRVQDGGRAMRMAVYGDHVVLGEEVIDRARIRTATSDGLELHLEITDPTEATVVIRRSLRGPRLELARAADALRP